MPTPDERIAYLEGRMEDHTRQTGELQAMLRETREEMQHRFNGVDTRFTAIDARLDAVNGEFGRLRDEMSRRFEAIDRQFIEMRGDMREQSRWIIGFQFTVLLAVLGAWLNLR